MHGQEKDASPFSHPAYTYNRNDIHNDPGVHAPKRRWSRVVLMPTIFLVGALAGLSANWWLKKPAGESFAGNAPAKVVRIPMQQPVPGIPVTGARRGISASELPYDGNPPPMDAQRAIAAAPLPPMKAGTAASSGASGAVAVGNGAAGSESDAAGTATAKAGEPDPPAPAPATTVASNASAAEVREADAKAAAAIEADVPKKTTPTLKRIAKDPEIERIQKQAALDQTDSTQAAKNREIERIRQQAAEELKKKNENQRAAEEVRTRTTNRPSVKPASERKQSRVAGMSKRAQLAQCERRSNFILREHCKWEICDGMWGKNGCPSYEKQASAY